MTKEEFEVVAELVALARRPLDTGSFDRRGIAQSLRLMRKRGLSASQAVAVVDRLNRRDDLPMWEHRPQLPDMTPAERMQCFAWSRFGLNRRKLLDALRDGSVYTALHAAFDPEHEDVFRLERIRREGRRYTITVQLVQRKDGHWRKRGAPTTEAIAFERVLRGAPVLYTLR